MKTNPSMNGGMSAHNGKNPLSLFRGLVIALFAMLFLPGAASATGSIYTGLNVQTISNPNDSWQFPLLIVGPGPKMIAMEAWNIKIMNKSGAISSPPADLANYHGNTGGDVSGFYDETVQRWVICAFGNFIISDTSDPTGSWSEQFSVNDGGDGGNLGYNADAYFWSSNGGPAGSVLYVINKASVLNKGTTQPIINLISEPSNPGMGLNPNSNPGDPFWDYNPYSGNPATIQKLSNVLSPVPTWTIYNVTMPGNWGALANGNIVTRNVNGTLEMAIGGSGETNGDVGSASNYSGWYSSNLVWGIVNVSSNPPSVLQSGELYASGEGYAFSDPCISPSGNFGDQWEDVNSNSPGFIDISASGRTPSDPANTLESPVTVDTSTGYTAQLYVGDYSCTVNDFAPDGTVLNSFWGCNGTMNGVYAFNFSPEPCPVAEVTAVGASGPAVSLSWNSSLGATSFNVLRGTASGGPYTQIANVSNSNYTAQQTNGTTFYSTYTDTSVTNGTYYYYVVQAVTASGTSPNSPQWGCQAGLAPPGTLTGLTAGATSGAGTVALTWNSVSGANHYDVFRSCSTGGPYKLIGSGVTSTNYTDTPPWAGTTYYYAVKAANSGGRGAYSTEVNAQPTAPPAYAPGGIQLTVNSSASITLQWPAIYGATSYTIYRGTTSGSYNIQETVTGPYNNTAPYGATVETFEDSGLAPGTTYYYEVKANNAYGSTTSQEISGTTQYTDIYSLIVKSTGMALNAYESGTTNGTPLVQWPWSSSTNDLWNITSAGNGQFYMTGLGSGLVPSVSGSSTTAGTTIQLWTYNGGACEEYTTTSVGGGYYNIVFVNSGQAMTVSGGATNSGAPIVQEPIVSGATDQQWMFQPYESPGTYALIVKSTGMALNASGGGTTSFTPLIQWPLTTSPNNLWNVNSVGNGQYDAIELQSGLSLNVEFSSTSAGTPLILYPYQGSNNELVTVQDASGGQGYDNLVFVNSGLAMTVSGGATTGGAPIVQEPIVSGATDAEWEFLPTVPTATYALVVASTGMTLDASGGGTTNVTPLIQYPWETLSEFWNVTSLDNGQYYAIGVKSGLAINVQSGQTNAGAAIVLYTYQGLTSEEFTLQPVASGTYYNVVFVNSGLAMTVSGGATTSGAPIVQEPIVSGATDQQWEFTPESSQ